MSDTLVLNPMFGFEELSSEELLEIDGGMTLGEMLLRSVCSIAGATLFGIKGANTASSVFGGNPYAVAAGGLAGCAFGSVSGWKAGGVFYNSFFS
jgi:hypothetical protein